MSLSSVNSQADITQLGVVARACLTSGQRGTVLASLSKAIYLLTDTNELFWIASADAPMHQRCATISSPLPGPSAGSPFHVAGPYLIIDSVFALDVSSASVWQAPHVDTKHILEISRLPARIDSFLSSLDISQAKGFGTLIPDILSLYQNRSVNPSLQSADPILSVAQPLVLSLARACLAHQPYRIPHHADALVGLGTGLTPSGDDFLGGFFFAIHVLQDAYPDLNFINYMIPVESYASRTHLISFTLLKDLARGNAIEPLHQIMNGLLNGGSFESIDSSISQLAQVGHSTGWDLLAGLLTGLLAAFQKRSFVHLHAMSPR